MSFGWKKLYRPTHTNKQYKPKITPSRCYQIWGLFFDVLRTIACARLSVSWREAPGVEARWPWGGASIFWIFLEIWRWLKHFLKHFLKLKSPCLVKMKTKNTKTKPMTNFQVPCVVVFVQLIVPCSLKCTWELAGPCSQSSQSRFCRCGRACLSW